MEFNGFSLVNLLKTNRKITQNMLAEIRTEISLTCIQKVVCHWYNITDISFFSSLSIRDIVIPRQVYCYFSKKMTDKTLAEIGDFIGKDHSTVLYSIKSINKLIENKQNLDDIALIPEIERDLKSRYKHKIIRQNKP